jgi:peptidoglycan/LPS O-acetylase OafA/YrhL
MSKKRPLGVTILAVLAALAAVAAIIHTLQMLHLWPISFGPVRFFTFSLIGAILWGILAAIYVWLVRRLWSVDPQAWMFLVILSVLNLVLDLVSILGQSSVQAMLPSLLVNGIILIYCLLPGTREAFGQT